MENLYTIAVPLNETGLEETDHGITKSENVQEWMLSEDQRNSLLQKFLYQIASEYHIPYMDYDEETNIPAGNIQECLKILIKKESLFTQDWDNKGFLLLKSAFEKASELKMPVYLFL